MLRAVRKDSKVLQVCRDIHCFTITPKRTTSMSAIGPNVNIHLKLKSMWVTFEVIDFFLINCNLFLKLKLTNHINAKHTGQRPYRCLWPGCEATFAYSSAQRKHQKHCHQMDVKPFHCEYSDCGKEFVEKRSLDLHMSKKHALNAVIIIFIKNYQLFV
jgi:hypothetical protein